MIDILPRKRWAAIEDQLQAILNNVVDMLDSESIESVRHYIDHGEYEMAFEGLFIELIRLQADLSTIDKNACCTLAVELGLSEHSVFDGNFWSKFRAFLRCEEV